MKKQVENRKSSGTANACEAITVNQSFEKTEALLRKHSITFGEKSKIKGLRTLILIAIYAVALRTGQEGQWILDLLAGIIFLTTIMRNLREWGELKQ